MDASVVVVVVIVGGGGDNTTSKEIPLGVSVRPETSISPLSWASVEDATSLGQNQILGQNHWCLCP